jgi:AcrR family transcriptional regulator
MKIPTPSKHRPSRRAFDIDDALDRALAVFWEHGYEGTSMAALTDALGINKPSLYAAFGNKEALFHRALERYRQGPAAYVGEALNQPSARQVIEHLLLKSADFLTNPRYPRGCLLVHGALSCSAEAGAVRDELGRCRKKVEDALRRRLEKAKADGDLPAATVAADLARYVITVQQGMTVQAIGGASRKELHRVVELTLSGLPQS